MRLDFATTGDNRNGIRIFWGEGSGYHSEDLSDPVAGRDRITELIAQGFTMDPTDLTRLEGLVKVFERLLCTAQRPVTSAYEFARRRRAELNKEIHDFEPESGAGLRDKVITNMAALGPSPRKISFLEKDQGLG